ncbi:hypothetical protein H4Q26_013553 [Puccinia striiformis f. sp. tritici PST-130]|nr:hypothetical protein H4Q26_013553 [Puccinia striiformis f. sp. tritici PST-130]
MSDVQADYLGLSTSGPYKVDHYRYVTQELTESIFTCVKSLAHQEQVSHSKRKPSRTKAYHESADRRWLP